MSRRPVLVPILSAAAVLAVSVLLAACSGAARPADAGDGGVVEHPSSSAASSAPRALDTSKFDACTLLPMADAKTLVGNELLAPLKVSTGDVASCTYQGDPNGPLGQVEVYVGDGAKQQLAIDKDKLQHAFTQPSGLGDEAWQEEGWIFARSGSTWISIRIVVLRDSAQFVQPLQTAMATALKNLAAAH